MAGRSPERADAPERSRPALDRRRGPAKIGRSVTLRDLLEHCSGLPGASPLLRVAPGRAAFETAICEEPLEYAPRTASIYSDPGFMLLGFAIENAAGAPLDRAVRSRGATRELGADVEAAVSAAAPSGSSVSRRPKTRRTARCAAARCTTRTRRRSVASPRTRDSSAPRPRSARARDGGCARPSLPLFAAKTTVPGSSRALGWDTMLPTSSCGTKMSPARDRSHRLHRHVAVDRSRAGSVCGDSDNRVHPTRDGRWHSGRAARVTRRDRYWPRGR